MKESENEMIYWGGDYVPVSQMRKLVLDENEPQEEYNEPFAIQSIKNKIEMLRFRESDIIKERIATLKQLKRYHDKHDHQLVEIEKSLEYFNKRLKDTEQQLKLAIKDLRKQYEYV